MLVAQGTSTAHYYIYESGTEEDSVACIIEIYGEPEESPGPEFEEVTLDELHARGYLTCDEQWQITPPDSVSKLTNESGFEAASWVTPIPDRNKKRVWARSKTIRRYS